MGTRLSPKIRQNSVLEGLFRLKPVPKGTPVKTASCNATKKHLQHEETKNHGQLMTVKKP